MLRKILKKLSKVTVAAGVAMAILTSVAGATSVKDYPRVAVMNFGNKAITSKGFRDQDYAMATEYAIYQLSASGWFDLIDYEELNTIAQMHNINNSGLVDPSTIVAMGQFAGAEYMIVGNVTGLTLKENIVDLQGWNAKAGNSQHVVEANVSVRIVDIKTGSIKGAGLGKGVSTSTMTEFGFTKFRNRKIEKEQIYTSAANSLSDEYNKQTKYNDSSKKNTTTGNYSTNGSNEENYNKDVKEEKKINEENYGNIPGALEVKFEPIAGDINADGQVDVNDIDVMETYLLYNQKSGRAGVFYEKYADVNGDGRITVKDYKNLCLIVADLYHTSVGYTKGLVCGGKEYEAVTQEDVNRLRNYVNGDRTKWMKLLAADVNDDGELNAYDVSKLEEWAAAKTNGMTHLEGGYAEQKYHDYNSSNHGKVIKEKAGEFVKLDSRVETINNKNNIKESFSSNNKNNGSVYVSNTNSNINNTPVYRF